MVLTAPLVAHALDAPRAAGAIRVMAITLPLAGLTSVPGSLLRRNLQMKTFFVADSANNLVSGILVGELGDRRSRAVGACLVGSSEAKC